MEEIKKLQNQTAEYAIEHITGKGMHSGIGWLRDSFNELCEATGANEYTADDINFDLDELVKYLKKEPWVAKIAEKPAHQRSFIDLQRIVEHFIKRYWIMDDTEIKSKDVADILKVADPLSHRHIAAQRVAVDCIHALDKIQLEQLDGILSDLAKNPELGKEKELTL